MANYKQRVVNFLDHEWATYVARFSRWSPEDGAALVHKQGYAEFRDMLAHIVAWWEEGMPIIMALAEDREYPRKKYDYDAFNAEAVAKYKSWPEGIFLNHFEKTRQKAVVDLKSIYKDTYEENRRLRSWTNGIFIAHAREHLVALSRFLLLDTLENEWSTYAQRFDALENKSEFLNAQGFAKFEDLLAHIVGWWNEALKIVKHALADPNYTYTEPNVDEFNATLVNAQQNASSAEVRKAFEAARLELVHLAQDLPESAFENPTLANWLATNVIEHYDDHSIK
ncbi:MAG: ClbS/DfsB family four-helix bundle protein [Anaerolineales bacterium]|nr:ClbS/DfsB family four-helix bundle protein [Anaerolineales bacterium]